MQECPVIVAQVLWHWTGCFSLPFKWAALLWCSTFWTKRKQHAVRGWWSTNDSICVSFHQSAGAHDPVTMKGHDLETVKGQWNTDDGSNALHDVLPYCVNTILSSQISQCRNIHFQKYSRYSELLILQSSYFVQDSGQEGLAAFQMQTCSGHPNLNITGSGVHLLGRPTVVQFTVSWGGRAPGTCTWLAMIGDSFNLKQLQCCSPMFQSSASRVAKSVGRCVQWCRCMIYVQSGPLLQTAGTWDTHYYLKRHEQTQAWLSVCATKHHH